MDYAIIESCEGFEWDSGNSTKSLIKHGITQAECEEIFFNQPLLLLEDQKHSQAESRYYALGKTNDDDRLFIVFTVRKKLIRIISARKMNKKERAIYEEA